MNQDLETLREELIRSLGGLNQRQTQLRPGGDAARWSIQQIVGHLLLTYAATERAMDARLEKGTATKARPKLVQRIGQFVVIRLERFPAGRRAPEVVSPVDSDAALPGGLLIGKVNAAITKLDDKLAEAEKVFGPKAQSVSHIVLGPLSLWQWRRFHLVHARHHIKQIQRIRAEYGA